MVSVNGISNHNSKDVFNYHMKHFDFSFLPCKMYYNLPMPAPQKRHGRSYETCTSCSSVVVSRGNLVPSASFRLKRKVKIFSF